MRLFRLLLTLLLASALNSQAESATILRVLNWGDYIDPEVISAFEAAHQVTIEYVEYNSVDEFSTLFFNPKNRFDFIFPASRTVRRLAEANLIQPLDLTRLPDYGNLRSDLMQEYLQQDSGGVHGIPYMWGTTGLGLNTAALQALGIEEQDYSWALLFNSALRKKVASCGIALLNERDEIFAAALRYLGHSVNTQNEAHIDQAGELIREALADVKYLHTTQYRDDLKAHKVCLVVGYSGDILAETDGDDALSYRIPQQGAAMWIDIMSIPTNSEQPALAYQFIRYMMEARIAAQNSNYLAYPTAMHSAVAYVDKDVLATPVIYPSVDVLRSLEAMKPLERRTNSRMHRLWVKAMCSGRSWCSVPMKSFF